jgi:formate hydrogenlyase subunit 4
MFVLDVPLAGLALSFLLTSINRQARVAPHRCRDRAGALLLQHYPDLVSLVDHAERLQAPAGFLCKVQQAPIVDSELILVQCALDDAVVDGALIKRMLPVWAARLDEVKLALTLNQQ